MKNIRKLADGTAATGSFDTSSVDLTNFDAPWTIDVIRSASDGSPTVAIQCSNDDTNWFDYKDTAGTSVTNGETFVDDEFKYRFIRISYTYGGGTGTVDINLYKYPDLK
jgi:hypothetical protein